MAVLSTIATDPTHCGSRWLHRFTIYGGNGNQKRSALIGGGAHHTRRACRARCAPPYVDASLHCAKPVSSMKRSHTLSQGYRAAYVKEALPEGFQFPGLL
jgi:hypothetical protein